MQSGTILVVEDDSLVRLDIADALLAAGFTVFEATSGDEALNVLCSAVCPDLVLTDVRMPGNLDGLQLARRIREQWPDLKIIIGSGEVTVPPDVADAFFAKPYDFHAILKSIHQLMGHGGEGVP